MYAAVMKHAYQTLFAVLAGLLLALPAFAADPVFPVNSRIGLVPPAGFTPSAKFPGFENQQANAAILFVELPAEAYADLEKGFTDEALKGRGMTVQSRQPMTLKDGRAFVVAGPTEAGGAKRHDTVMVANLSGLAALVSVQMIEASRASLTDEVLRAALQTLAIRKEVPPAERLAVLPYKIGNLAGFRIIRSSQNGVAILTDGPNDEVAAIEQPFLLTAVLPGEAPKPEDRATFARRVFSSAPGIKDIKITRAEPLRMGQAQGFEIVADAKDAKSGTDVTTVQWLRFGQTGHLQIFAIARRTAWSTVFPRLRQIRDGIDLR
jgi:hypothetical protein